MLGVAMMPGMARIGYTPRRPRAVDEPINRDALRALTSVALDAARQAGATYADVQIRTTLFEQWGATTWDSVPYWRVGGGASVRAFVRDCWGVVSLDGAVTDRDMARLGRDAVAQSRMGSVGAAGPLEWAPSPAVPDGDWRMPVELDPFVVSPNEKHDFLMAVVDDVTRWDNRISNAAARAKFIRDTRTFASTDGTFCTQQLFNTGGEISFFLGNRQAYTGDFLTPAGAGWEYLVNAPYRDRMPRWIDLALRHQNPVPIEPGRFDVVFGGFAAAELLNGTIGIGTELDRALGRYANDVGTSFITDPLGMLGILAVGAPSITVTANRSAPRGAATVKWDDEGVAPQETTLVNAGVLADMQTTRDTVPTLKAAYDRTGRPVRSNGCAGRPHASDLPGQNASNLSLAPGAGDNGFDDLIKGVKRGYAILGNQVSMDWQVLNGAGRPHVGAIFVIRNGQLAEGVMTHGTEFLLRTPELWKSVVTIGGRSKVESYGFVRGYEDDVLSNSVATAPITVAQLRLVNALEQH